MRRHVRNTDEVGPEGRQPKTTSPRRGLGRLMALFLPGLFLLVGLVIWPLFLDPLPGDVSSPSPPGRGTSVSSLNPSLVPLWIEEAFLKNRLAIAKTDSVALAIDLVDSLVTLDIKGVPVRTCKIESYSISGALSRARHSPRLAGWLSKPFVLRRQWGTIPKAPIKKVDAPKDTLEAEKLATFIPPPDSGDVAFILAFTRNLTVKVSQTEEFSGKGKALKARMNVWHQGAALLEEFSGLRRHRRVWPPLTVSMELARADAKAIYRALPHHALLAFRF